MSATKHNQHNSDSSRQIKKLNEDDASSLASNRDNSTQSHKGESANQSKGGSSQDHGLEAAAQSLQSLSSMIRQFANSAPEMKLRRWFLLMVGERVEVLETRAMKWGRIWLKKIDEKINSDLIKSDSRHGKKDLKTLAVGQAE